MSERTVVTVLGAGAMGAALTRPLAENGHDVRLWGTWLDDDIVEDLRAGRPHPRIQVPVDPRVRVFASGELGSAMDGATTVALAISSDGVVDVLRRAVPHLQPGTLVPITTKGFGRDPAGRIGILPPLLEAEIPAGLRESTSVLAIGGPCKANEVAVGRPTATVYAGERDAATRAQLLAQTDWYRIQVIEDIAGLEVAAAMKNVYAMALGMCEGLAAPDRTGPGTGSSEPWHDLAAATYTQALLEMARLADVFGGQRDTVYGLSGSGDLQVTNLSGRNKLYGVRLGRGEPAVGALAEMRAAGQTVEGVPACALAHELVTSGSMPGLDPRELPLLAALVRVLAGEVGRAGGSALAEVLAAAVLPGPGP